MTFKQMPHKCRADAYSRSARHHCAFIPHDAGHLQLESRVVPYLVLLQLIGQLVDEHDGQVPLRPLVVQREPCIKW
jgi:hypothetical protein